MADSRPVTERERQALCSTLLLASFVRLPWYQRLWLAIRLPSMMAENKAWRQHSATVAAQIYTGEIKL